MAPINAQRVEQDLAAFLAHEEQPASEWVAILPAGAAGLIAGYEVLPHVQSFADKVRVATGVKSIGTYPGHSPSLERALDLFVPTTSATPGNAICTYAIDNQVRFGVRYVIYRQRIWHRLDPVWRGMEDRGDLTQNHYDHVHISFETTAADTGPEPEPKPEPQEEEEVTMFVFDAPRERGGEVWVSDGVFRKRVRTGDTWPALEKAKAKHIGVAPVGLFDDLIDVEARLEALEPDKELVQAGGVDLSAIADLVAAKVADLIHKRLAS